MEEIWMANLMRHFFDSTSTNRQMPLGGGESILCGDEDGFISTLLLQNGND
jgi:hypothetical protein